MSKKTDSPTVFKTVNLPNWLKGAIVGFVVFFIMSTLSLYFVELEEESRVVFRDDNEFRWALIHTLGIGPGFFASAYFLNDTETEALVMSYLIFTIAGAICFRLLKSKHFLAFIILYGLINTPVFLLFYIFRCCFR